MYVDCIWKYVKGPQQCCRFHHETLLTLSPQPLPLYTPRPLLLECWLPANCCCRCLCVFSVQFWHTFKASFSFMLGWGKYLRHAQYERQQQRSSSSATANMHVEVAPASGGGGIVVRGAVPTANSPERAIKVPCGSWLRRFGFDFWRNGVGRGANCQLAWHGARGRGVERKNEKCEAKSEKRKTKRNKTRAMATIKRGMAEEWGVPRNFSAISKGK